MIAKITKGKSFRGILDYALKKEGGKLVGGTMVGETPRELSWEFSVARELSAHLKNPVWHCSLSLLPGEDLSDEKWSEAADIYMNEMEFSYNHQYVVVKHTDTDHIHVHIIASVVGLEGERYNDSFEKRRAQKACDKLEEHYDLSRTSRSKAKKRGPSKNEIEKAERRGEVIHQVYIQEAIDRAFKVRERLSPEELQVKLIDVGIKFEYTKSKAGKVLKTKYTYRGLSFGGSKLGGSYTWGQLQRRKQDEEVRIAGARVQESVTKAEEMMKANKVSPRQLRRRTKFLMNDENSNEKKLSPVEGRAVKMLKRKKGRHYASLELKEINNEIHGRGYQDTDKKRVKAHRGQKQNNAGRVDEAAGEQRPTGRRFGKFKERERFAHKEPEKLRGKLQQERGEVAGGHEETQREFEELLSRRREQLEQAHRGIIPGIRNLQEQVQRDNERDMEGTGGSQIDPGLYCRRIGSTIKRLRERFLERERKVRSDNKIIRKLRDLNSALARLGGRIRDAIKRFSAFDGRAADQTNAKSITRKLMGIGGLERMAPRIKGIFVEEDPVSEARIKFGELEKVEIPEIEQVKVREPTKEEKFAQAMSEIRSPKSKIKRSGKDNDQGMRVKW